MTTEAIENTKLLKKYNIKRASDIEKMEPSALRDKIFSAYMSGPGKRFWAEIRLGSQIIEPEKKKKFKD